MAGVDITELDAHEQPSAQLKAIWKSISRTDQKELLNGDTLDDIQSPKKLSDFVLAGQVSAAQLEAAFRHVLPDSSEDAPLRDVPIYVHHLIPGPFGGSTCDARWCLTLVQAS